MGGSLSFEVYADSLAQPGEKSALSSAIDGVTAERLLAGMEEYVKGGNTRGGQESEFDVSERDGGILVSQTWKIPEFLGGGSFEVFTLWKFDHEQSMFQLSFFNNKAALGSGEASFTGVCKIHPDPVRVEFWQEYREVRASGRVMKAMLDKVLKEMGSSVKTEVDQPSPSDSSKLSVLSGAIEDVPDVTPETFLDRFKEILVDSMAATELPDGTLIEERSSMLDVLGVGKKNFAKHVLCKDKMHVFCYEYADDESLTEMVSTTHLQVHKEPFRLEQYNMQKAGRRAGQAQVNTIQGFVEKVLKHLNASA